MATSRRVVSSNPFYSGDDDDDNVDDFEFITNPKQGSGYMLGDDKSWQPPMSDEERKLQLMLERRREIEESTLASTKSSLGMVYESEQIGVATAQELIRQREQLQKCEDSVDEINSNLTVTQKHLNSIKSIFGGVKNWWGQKSKDNFGRPIEREVVPSSKLSAAMERSEIESAADTNQDNHPAFRVRGLVNDEADVSVSRSKQVDDKIDENLGELSVGISRLKHLALGLGDEIEEQDEILNRLDTKVDKADQRIYGQNREMARILKK